jgi:hypothetical protein
MDNGVSHRLGTRPDFQHGDDFGASIDGQPNPQGVGLLAGLGAKFIQLDVQELQALKQSLVQ